MFSNKLQKLLGLTIASTLLFNAIVPSAKVLATTLSDRGLEYQLTILKNHEDDLNYIIQKIEEYSYYDGEILHIDHKIVADGILTENQYQEMKKIDDHWKQFIDHQRKNAPESSGRRHRRAIPAVLIVILKGLAVIIGTAAVERMINDFMTWGLKEGCKAYQQYGAIKSFCQANGYL